MQELLVVEVIPREKGRTSIRFDNGMEVLLYKGEVRKLSLREGTVISREKYDEIIYEILGTRHIADTEYLERGRRNVRCFFWNEWTGRNISCGRS